MAIFEAPKSDTFRKYDIQKMCPEGLHGAVCVDLMETFQVEEPSYNDPSIMVTKDKCRPLFAVEVDGEIHFVQPLEFNISSSPKSKIYEFIKNWTGRGPMPGFDTLDLIGQTAQIQVDHETSKKGTVYATIATIARLMDPSKAPKLEDCIPLIPGGARSEVPVAASSSDKGADENPF